MTRINGEPVELVTDFAALRVGDIVYCKPCDICGGCHRGILLKFIRDAYVVGTDGKKGVSDMWIYSPASRCLPDEGIGRGFTPVAVTNRALFRVINPPAEQQQARQRRKAIAR